MAAGSLAIAGCTSTTSTRDRTASPSEPPHTTSPTPSQEEELPEDCPKSQRLRVEWPGNLNESTVAAFVETYEDRYYPRVAFDYEPPSRYGSVGSTISRVENVTDADGGWRVHFSGTIGVTKTEMFLEATRTDPPEEAEVLSRSQFDDERLIELLDDAAKTGEAERSIGPGEVDAYVDRFRRLSVDFDISSAEPQDGLYVQVYGLTIELMVSLFIYHADHGWKAWYYVDEHEVWRSGKKAVDPRDGQLLECRVDP